MKNKKLTKDQKIKVLSKALKFYASNGTRKVMDDEHPLRGLRIENGYIADKALVKAGVRKKRLTKDEFSRDNEIRKQERKKIQQKAQAELRIRFEKAFRTPLILSPDLAILLERRPNDRLTRPIVTKYVWQYIHKNGLQDKVNRRMINCDDKLGRVANGRTQITMFELTKYISKHVTFPRDEK